MAASWSTRFYMQRLAGSDGPQAHHWRPYTGIAASGRLALITVSPIFAVSEPRPAISSIVDFTWMWTGYPTHIAVDRRLREYSIV
jgi:hypothetical protein